MHPYVIEVLAAERRKDLLREAGHRQRVGRHDATAGGRTVRWRRNVGWRLVEVGLRLALPDAPSVRHGPRCT